MPSPCGRQPIRYRRAVGELEGPYFGQMDPNIRIITTNANELVAEIHDRMPLIVAPGDMNAGSAMIPIRTT